MKKNRILPVLILLISSISILFLFYGKVLLNPNSFLFSSESDALKNYYTISYYLEHDKGFNSTSMNYPFGEHVIYTDNQPIISFILNFIDENILSISQYSIGIIHTLLFIGVFLCVYFCYKILLNFGIPTWYACLFALLVAFLSPQISRFNGHYSLGYCFYVPMIWYFLIRFMEKRNLLFGAFILMLVITIFGWIHLYYLPIASFFIIAFSVLYLIENRNNLSGKKRRIVFLFLAALTPIIITKLIIYLTDPVIDRPAAPFGFTHYRAFFESVFLPINDPIKSIITQLIPYSNNRGESHAYVGLIGLFVLVFTVFRILKGIKSKAFQKKPFPVLSNRLNRFLFAGTLVLLFSMAIPFKWNMEFLLEIIPPLKQFRSLGRFAWVFYYVFTIYSAYIIFLVLRLLSIQNKPIVRLIFFLCVVSLWSYEVYNYLACQTKNEVVDNIIYNQNDNIAQSIYNQGYQPKEFQAIMSLPYFAIGTEKLTVFKSSQAFKNAVETSMSTGLPLIQSVMSRSSITQSLSLVQLLSDTLIEKEIIKKLPSEKPLLLIVSGQKFDYMENYLIGKGKEILTTKNKNYYELPLSAFQHYKDSLDKKRLYEIEDGRTSNKNSFYYWNSFDENKQDYTLTGNGSNYHKTGNSTLVFMPLDPKKIKSKKLEVSCWMHVDSKVYGLPNLIAKSGETTVIANSQHTTDVYKNWVKVTTILELPPEPKELTIELDGNETFIDDLLVRELGIDIYTSINEKTYKKNNYTITR